MGINPLKKIRKILNRSSFSRRASERFLSQRSFSIDGSSYEYIVHPHNYTWTNERTVEISIAKAWLESHQMMRILEVGNVSRHYFGGNHDVVDKYEKADGVINVDIVDYMPSQNYQCIFAISTLEHVGWDRDKKEPDKIIQAVDKLKSLLEPDGELMITVPLGFNCFLDEFIENNALGFDQYQYLKRVNSQNEWIQSPWQDVRGSQYNAPYPNANAVVVATYRKPSN